MGKVLIIKNADFSQNAIEQVALSNVPFNISFWSVNFLDYQSNKNINQLPYDSIAGQSMRLVVADVSAHVGESISITSENPIVSNAYYACFTASLGDLTYQGIPSLGGASSQTPHAIVPIGSTFNISSTAQQKKTITKTVPNGAKYLVFTADFGGNLTLADIKVEVQQ